ncbi:hypothetical protein PC128_g12909 [Phytophthora cactorum]|nr:hypothetical protein PC128_g12909 [Phytophthora cactorum]
MATRGRTQPCKNRWRRRSVAKEIDVRSEMLDCSPWQKISTSPASQRVHPMLSLCCPAVHS